MGARTAAYARCWGRCGTSERIERSSAPRPCRSTTSGAVSASAPLVTTAGAPKLVDVMGSPAASRESSGDDAEAAGPRDLPASGEPNLQEAESLELTTAGEEP